MKARKLGRTENVEEHEVGEPRQAGGAADADLVAGEGERQIPVRHRVRVHPHIVGDGAKRAQNHLQEGERGSGERDGKIAGMRIREVRKKM